MWNECEDIYLHSQQYRWLTRIYHPTLSISTFVEADAIDTAAMPLIRDFSSSSSDVSLNVGNVGRDTFQVVNDAEYPAASLPGYSEKALSEQLEPIAVVGMGKHCAQVST